MNFLRGTVQGACRVKRLQLPTLPIPQQESGAHAGATPSQQRGKRHSSQAKSMEVGLMGGQGREQGCNSKLCQKQHSQLQSWLWNHLDPQGWRMSLGCAHIELGGGWFSSGP
ncbi:hypothetical protein [Paucibacter sp. DJ2R-2]|uniref:hypothetical protein n=1 Tax=Paucibacter sp. DJ2R-2 TaxID=2893558 RepID=UPI0021E4631A|nr:hypothetical protein [Paucibacter sp. DJ2R-2]MCV2423082.1 hypothetical protein [Paucibacter sp. DJ4R-1]MCV2440978.1 hypothetical protein [Paucibacter sp. DJ2R-2]